MLAGIDLGGTQVRVALARSDGKLITSVKTKTPLLKSPQGMVDWAASEIDRLRGNQKVRSIAIGGRIHASSQERVYQRRVPEVGRIARPGQGLDCFTRSSRLGLRNLHVDKREGFKCLSA